MCVCVYRLSTVLTLSLSFNSKLYSKSELNDNI